MLAPNANVNINPPIVDIQGPKIDAGIDIKVSKPVILDIIFGFELHFFFLLQQIDMIL